jgi:hypothetical protein
MPLPFRRLHFALIVPLALLGCDGNEDGDDEHAEDTQTESESDTHGDTEAGDTEASDCAAETRDDDFAIGLSKSGTSVQATFVSSDPAPPIKGNNTWVLTFTDLEGQPLSGLGIVATPMMPDHGHGTPIAAVVTELETPGQYEITPVNLFMAGYWQITLDVTLPDDGQDSLMFGFCVE